MKRAASAWEACAASAWEACAVSAACAAVLSFAGCALPVISANTFLPAGDLRRGDLQATISMEAGRVLAGPSDVHDLPATPPEAQKYEVSTWVASDASLRWQAFGRLTLEAQVKLTNPIAPFVPNLAGGAVGARLRLLDRAGEGGYSVEVGARAVGVAASQRIDRFRDGRSQTDTWDYRAFGVELPAVVTYRVNSLFAVTASPFLRAYWIRAWHTSILRQVAQDVGTSRQAELFYSPVLSGGVGGAVSFDLGPVTLSPGAALELATRPGPGAATHFLFEPGVSLGTRF